jgi:hypothetical protein
MVDGWVLEKLGDAWTRRQVQGELLTKGNGRPDPTGPLVVDSTVIAVCPTGCEVFEPWNWTNGELASRHIMESRNAP